MRSTGMLDPTRRSEGVPDQCDMKSLMSCNERAEPSVLNLKLKYNTSVSVLGLPFPTWLKLTQRGAIHKRQAYCKTADAVTYKSWHVYVLSCICPCSGDPQCIHSTVMYMTSIKLISNQYISDHLGSPVSFLASHLIDVERRSQCTGRMGLGADRMPNRESKGYRMRSKALSLHNSF